MRRGAPFFIADIGVVRLARHPKILHIPDLPRPKFITRPKAVFTLVLTRLIRERGRNFISDSSVVRADDLNPGTLDTDHCVLGQIELELLCERWPNEDPVLGFVEFLIKQGNRVTGSTAIFQNSLQVFGLADNVFGLPVRNAESDKLSIRVADKLHLSSIEGI